MRGKKKRQDPDAPGLIPVSYLCPMPPSLPCYPSQYLARMDAVDNK